MFYNGGPNNSGTELPLGPTWILVQPMSVPFHQGCKLKYTGMFQDLHVRGYAHQGVNSISLKFEV